MSLDTDSIEALANALADRVADKIASRLECLMAQGQTRLDWPAGRLTFKEPEAAALLGMRRHQLRDRRLKGDIACCSPEGARPVLYTRQNLLDYINRANHGNDRTENKPGGA